MPTSRRQFLGGLGYTAAIAWLPLDRTEPDLILFNGNIWTVNARQPRAGHRNFRRAIPRYRIERRKYCHWPRATRRRSISAERPCSQASSTRTPIPAVAGLSHLRMVDCDLRSISEILKALRERAAKTPAGQVGARLQV